MMTRTYPDDSYNNDLTGLGTRVQKWRFGWGEHLISVYDGF